LIIWLTLKGEIKSMKLNLKEINLIALFTAVTAILAQISIPVPFSPVPVTLSILGVMLSSLILGRKCGIISQVVYILLGTAGVPVFAGFRGGLSVLLSPTGGYIISYPIIALVIGTLLNQRTSTSFFKMAGIALAGLIICYAFGTTWLAIVASLGPAEAIAAGVLPFILPDVAKVIISVILGRQIKNALAKAGLASV